MGKHNALVLAIDGLRASACGAYGDRWIGTGAIDQLAAEAMLCEWCFAPAIHLPEIYASLWQGVTASQVALSRPDLDHSLPATFRLNGFYTVLVSDRSDVVGLSAAAQFDEQIEVDATSPKIVADIGATGAASLFSEVVHQMERADDRLSQHGVPTYLWVDSAGLYGRWDAPWQLARELVDETDPLPYDGVLPPEIEVDHTQDPDVRLKYAARYGGQLRALDALLGAALDPVLEGGNQENGDSDWFITMLGLRGFPLAEHGMIGGVDPRLYAEQVQVPLLLRFPNALGGLVRSHALFTFEDVYTLHAAWAKGDRPTSCDEIRRMTLAAQDRVGVLSRSSCGRLAWRTADWSLVASQSEDGIDQEAAELFVRPDDRWEANDIASRCRDDLEYLIAQAWEQLGRNAFSPIDSNAPSEPDSTEPGSTGSASTADN